jgi:hypothetical protein
MPAHIDTLLLIALPASGKSEVRKYMLNSPKEQRLVDFHVADTVQIDDYPYVEFFHEVDDTLADLGEGPLFYHGSIDPFLNGRDWGTLLKLLSQDYRILKDPSLPLPSADPQVLFHRIDLARSQVGLAPVFGPMHPRLREELGGLLVEQAAKVLDHQFKIRPANIDDYTLVIEFARGGPAGPQPVAAPHGYAWNLAQLSKQILARASALYVWVDPQESLRKNRTRDAKPSMGKVDTAIFHMCPETVMREDYSGDDIQYLRGITDRPDTLTIHAYGRRWYVPIAVFDNRVDLTTFTREPSSTWKPENVAALHAGLTDGFARLWEAHGRLAR